MGFVAISLPRGCALTPDAARLLVDFALRRRWVSWETAALELFDGAGGALVFARPVGTVARCVLPHFHK